MRLLYLHVGFLHIFAIHQKRLILLEIEHVQQVLWSQPTFNQLQIILIHAQENQK